MQDDNPITTIMKHRINVEDLAPDQLVAELRELVNEAQKFLSTAPGELSEAALTALRERFDAAQERLSEVYTGAKNQVIAGAKRADETIRQHPYESIAVALGIGVLLGLFVSRRNR